jgi:hypothetical protein
MNCMNCVWKKERKKREEEEKLKSQRDKRQHTSLLDAFVKSKRHIRSQAQQYTIKIKKRQQQKVKSFTFQMSKSNWNRNVYVNWC